MSPLARGVPAVGRTLIGVVPPIVNEPATVLFAVTMTVIVVAVITAGEVAAKPVPVTVTFDKKSESVKNMLGISAIADISFIARDVYNASSELRQILRDQTFAFLTLQEDVVHGVVDTHAFNNLAVRFTQHLSFLYRLQVIRYVLTLLFN